MLQTFGFQLCARIQLIGKQPGLMCIVALLTGAKQNRVGVGTCSGKEKLEEALVFGR